MMFPSIVLSQYSVVLWNIVVLHFSYSQWRSWRFGPGGKLS